MNFTYMISGNQGTLFGVSSSDGIDLDSVDISTINHLNPSASIEYLKRLALKHFIDDLSTNNVDIFIGFDLINQDGTRIPAGHVK